MVSAKMKRRLKRRTKSPLYTQIQPQQHSDRSVSSPPRLRRDNSPPTTEFTFSLDVDPTTSDVEQGTISTVTNDVAFRERVGRRCGFDEMGYSRSNSGGSSKNGGKQVKRQSPQQLVKEESYLYQSGTKKTNRTTAASPMGVNELDFATAQFEWTDKVSTKQSPHSTKLNLKKSMRKDDDTFFYSESAPSEATTDTKLVGEEITLGSSSSYLQSFDILENRKVERLGHQMGRGSPIRYSGAGGSGVGGGGGGLSQRKELEEVVAALEADPVVVEPPPPPPPPAVTPELAPPQLQPQPTIETSPPRTRSQPINNSSNAIAITDNNESNNNNNDDKKAAEAGCTVPEVLQEFVNDIQSVLTQAISVAYLACSESEQCLSRFQGEDTTDTEKVQSDPPANSKKSMLDTIDEGHMVASNETKSPNNKGKVWTGDYLNNRTGTEETAENSSQEGGERSAEEGGRTNRLRKFLSLVKSRK